MGVCLSKGVHGHSSGEDGFCTPEGVSSQYDSPNPSGRYSFGGLETPGTSAEAGDMGSLGSLFYRMGSRSRGTTSNYIVPFDMILGGVSGGNRVRHINQICSGDFSRASYLASPLLKGFDVHAMEAVAKSYAESAAKAAARDTFVFLEENDISSRIQTGGSTSLLPSTRAENGGEVEENWDTRGKSVICDETDDTITYVGSCPPGELDECEQPRKSVTWDEDENSSAPECTNDRWVSVLNAVQARARARRRQIKKTNSGRGQGSRREKAVRFQLAWGEGESSDVIQWENESDYEQDLEEARVLNFDEGMSNDEQGEVFVECSEKFRDRETAPEIYYTINWRDDSCGDGEEFEDENPGKRQEEGTLEEGVSGFSTSEASSVRSPFTFSPQLTVSDISLSSPKLTSNEIFLPETFFASSHHEETADSFEFRNVEDYGEMSCRLSRDEPSSFGSIVEVEENFRDQEMRCGSCPVMRSKDQAAATSKCCPRAEEDVGKDQATNSEGYLEAETYSGNESTNFHMAEEDFKRDAVGMGEQRQWSLGHSTCNDTSSIPVESPKQSSPWFEKDVGQRYPLPAIPEVSSESSPTFEGDFRGDQDTSSGPSLCTEEDFREESNANEGGHRECSSDQYTFNFETSPSSCRQKSRSMAEGVRVNYASVPAIPVGCVVVESRRMIDGSRLTPMILELSDEELPERGHTQLGYYHMRSLYSGDSLPLSFDGDSDEESTFSFHSDLEPYSNPHENFSFPVLVPSFTAAHPLREPRGLRRKPSVADLDGSGSDFRARPMSSKNVYHEIQDVTSPSSGFPNDNGKDPRNSGSFDIFKRAGERDHHIVLQSNTSRSFSSAPVSAPSEANAAPFGSPDHPLFPLPIKASSASNEPTVPTSRSYINDKPKVCSLERARYAGAKTRPDYNLIDSRPEGQQDTDFSRERHLDGSESSDFFNRDGRHYIYREESSDSRSRICQDQNSGLSTGNIRDRNQDSDLYRRERRCHSHGGDRDTDLYRCQTMAGTNAMGSSRTPPSTPIQSSSRKHPAPFDLEELSNSIARVSQTRSRRHSLKPAPVVRSRESRGSCFSMDRTDSYKEEAAARALSANSLKEKALSTLGLFRRGSCTEFSQSSDSSGSEYLENKPPSPERQCRRCVIGDDRRNYAFEWYCTSTPHTEMGFACRAVPHSHRRHCAHVRSLSNEERTFAVRN